MSQTQSYKPSPDVMLSIVDDGAVLLHLKRGIYFGLNSVGADIWNMLSEGLGQRDCIAQLVEKYDIDAAAASADYERLMADLRDQKLIERR